MISRLFRYVFRRLFRHERKRTQIDALTLYRIGERADKVERTDGFKPTEFK